MKVKYLATLFAVGILSLGLVTSCAPTADTGGDAPTQMDDGAAPADPNAAPPADSGTGQ